MRIMSKGEDLKDDRPSKSDNPVYKDYDRRDYGYQPTGSGKVKKPPTNTPNQGSSGKKDS